MNQQQLQECLSNLGSKLSYKLKQTQKGSTLIEFHNEVIASFNEKLGCEKCKGNGFVIVEGGVFGTSRECECKINFEAMAELKQFIMRNKLDSGLSKVYSLKSFDGDFDLHGKVIEFILQEDSLDWLYFGGECGIGKTYFAVVIAQVMLALGNTVEFHSVPKLLDSFRPNANKDETLMERCEECDVLILDDIGQEKVSEWVLERLYILVNERYSRGKKTIFTSNTDKNNLYSKLPHEALISRIMHRAVQIPLKKEVRRVAK